MFKTSILLILLITSCHICSSQNLSAECQRDWDHYLNSASEEWALDMADATGKVESGTREGNVVFEGEYRQCIRIQENITNPHSIRGLYCIGLWTWLHRVFTRGLGFCIPHTCSDADAKILLYEVSVSPLPTPPEKAHVECRRDPKLADDPGAIVTIVILCAFGVIVLAASVFDVVYKRTSKHKRMEKKPKEYTNEAVTLEEDNGNNIETTISNGHVQFGKDAIGSVPNYKKNKYVANPEHDSHKVATEGKSYNLVKAEAISQHSKEDKKQSTFVRVILAFSLYSNVPRVLSAKSPPGSYNCLNGIRFLTMSWVILGHTYSIGTSITEAPTVSNKWPMYKYFMEWHAEVFLFGTISVDVFFMLSGFLVAVVFLKTLEKVGKVSCRMMSLYYFHRYWRLIPLYVAALLINTKLIPYFAHGPFVMNSFYTLSKCSEVWWQHILFIWNLWPSDQIKSCFDLDWYLANDFQFYVMAPAFLIPAFYKPVAGLVLMIAGYCGSMIARLVLYYKLIYDKDPNMDWETDIYIRPWTRAVTYFIGMILGFIIFRLKGKKLKIHWVLVMLGWFIAVSLIILPIYGTQFFQPVDAGLVVWDSCINSMFVLGVAWIIFASIQGYGGVLSTILSWRAWIPLSRLTYAGYLIHAVFIRTYSYTVPRQMYIYHLFMIYVFLGNLVLTMGASFVLTLVFERPMMGLEKVMIPHRL